MKYSIILGAFALAFGSASSANAALIVGDTNCAVTDISPAAAKCRGYYKGNLNGNSPTMRTDTAAALNALLGTSFSSSNFPVVETLGSLSGNIVNFMTPLYGDTVISFHVGAAKGQATGVGYNGTAFYQFDAGNIVGGLDSITFNRAGLSNARLYRTSTFVAPAVPEPSTWLMLILGFAFAGSMMRRAPVREMRVRYAF